MSAIKHTPGPWEYFDGGLNGFAILPANNKGPRLAHVYYGKMADGKCEGYESAEANARRIVACVNYCEGVSTAEIEAAPKSMNLRTILDVFDSMVAKAVS